ncbi:MAG: SpoIIE family protein phosphatase [Alphaproteobacteria bacterium]|jgi:sigma-B regulation protein RsbU (phosphoserine phosphatase)|nr:SpoIIE family protein phosphatase [Alphaproteobacteria bacterium]
MLLRTRIALLVAAVFLLTFGGLLLAGLQRERLHERPHAEIAITGTEALWREIVAGAVAPLDALAGRIAADRALIEALRAGDEAPVRDLLVGWTSSRIAATALSDLQILDAEGRMVFAASAAAEPARLLDLGTLQMVAAGEAPGGIRQTAADHFRLVVARPLPVRPSETLVLALAAPIDPALGRFAAALGAEAFLLNTRGRLIEQSGTGDWQALGLRLPQRVATVTQAAQGERLFAVTAVPLADLAAGSAGLLVTVRDATETLSALRGLTWLTVGGTAGMLLLALAGMTFVLRAGFRPLDRAVDVLGALSRGDTAVDLAKESDDEIGRIADAVHGLRRKLVALNDSRRQRELQRRRQERFVRKQMETLAGTLEAGAREEVLSNLQRIVAASGGRQRAADGPSPATGIQQDDQLGPLAAVLQQMSGRVVDQHRRLSEVIARLREALVRETQLASLQQELQIARDLQRSVLPVDFPDRPAFAVYGTMESAREVGGDFYDFFDRPDGRFVVVIADVSGKGVPAAFFMAICRTLLKAIALFEPDPAACLRQLNELLAAGNDQMMFVTLFFAVFDPESGRLDCVNAGHNPPFLVGRDGAVRLLDGETDMAVAVTDDLDFTAHSHSLAPGERLVLYTDGVTEAFSPDDEPFGEDRMAAILAATAQQPPAGLAARLVAAIHDFENGGEQSDDITLLVLDRKPGADAAG